MDLSTVVGLILAWIVGVVTGLSLAALALGLASEEPLILYRGQAIPARVEICDIEE